MSTRCQVKIVDAYNELWFYRHSDGYPDGALPTLRKFMQWVADGQIRDNVEQAAGWLVIIGNDEYSEVGSGYPEPQPDGYSGWKVGAYEPSVPRFHGDIQYFYILDLEAKTITVQATNGFNDNQSFTTKNVYKFKSRVA